MKLFYLIGESIDKSLSPYIHSWIYNFLDINADYQNKDIPVNHFENSRSQLINDINNESLSGLNITNPYKVNIIDDDIILSNEAKEIQAINCLYKYKNNIIGDNTDWIGFIKSIDYNQINLKKYNVKVLGLGGAAKAIIYGLQNLGIKNFKIYNRTKKSIIIKNQEYNTYSLDELTNNTDDNIFVINCIPGNMIYNIFTDGILKSICFFYDLSYHRSDFHAILEQKDIKVILGLDMLIYQAIKSVEIWLGYEFLNQIDIEQIKDYLKNKSLC